MADYISREAAYESLNRIKSYLHQPHPEYSTMMFWEVEDFIETLPAADVRPVVHGKWNVVEKPLEKATICECSECNHHIWMYDGDNRWNFCTKCGADMRTSDAGPCDGGTDSSAGSE